MTVERLLQINVAAMAVLGTLLFGMGQQDITLPIVCFLLAVTAVTFTDTLKWFRLHPNVANIFAVAVAIYTLKNFFQATSEEKLLAIAYLLAYLQFALLFEVKQPRIYWHLMVLSLLQVVVAAALDFGLEGAVIMVIYFGVSISSLTLFLLHREALRVKRFSVETPRVELIGEAQPASADESQATQAASAVSIAVGSPERALDDLPWRLLVRQLAGVALVTFTIAAVIFYTIPRRDEAADSSITDTHYYVAYEPEVDLGEENDEIEVSDDLAMRVSFKYFDTGKPYNVIGEPYIRGAVLTRYHRSRNGRRTRWRGSFGLLERDNLLSYRDPRTDYIIQEIQLEPGVLESRGDDYQDVLPLFGAFPVTKLKQTYDDIYYDRNLRQLFRAVGGSFKSYREGFKYRVGTTGFKGGYQVPAVPYRAGQVWRGDRPMGEGEHHELTDFDESSFEYLIRLTERVLVENRVNRRDPLQVALALETHLRTSEIYTYSLDLTFEPVEEGNDPVEDFLKHRQVGHCEYFASALALMLRYQRIPARICVGYKGGEYNSVGKYFEITEADAHTWVEAYLPGGQEGRGMLGLDEVGPNGVWMRLDPTPPQDTSRLADYQVTFLSRIADGLDYAQVLWADYVVQLSTLRQPVFYKAFEDGKGLYAPSVTQHLWSIFRDDEELELSENRVLQISQRWLTLIAGIVGLIFCVAIAAMYRQNNGSPRRKRIAAPRWLERVVKPVAPWLVGWYQDEDERARPYIDFYERLVDILSKHGFDRLSGQTQREFASAVSAEFAKSQQRQHVAQLPPKIIDNYYRVRFGGVSLDQNESETITRDLRILRDALAIEPQ